MDERLERRVSANEDAFRKANEAIERGLWQGEEHSLVAFRCECASLDCASLLDLTRHQYERVRARPRWFFVQPGHEIPEVETVVETHEFYLVVEKRGAAGAAAEATDPRDR